MTSRQINRLKQIWNGEKLAIRLTNISCWLAVSRRMKLFYLQTVQKPVAGNVLIINFLYNDTKILKKPKLLLCGFNDFLRFVFNTAISFILITAYAVFSISIMLSKGVLKKAREVSELANKSNYEAY